MNPLIVLAEAVDATAIAGQASPAEQQVAAAVLAVFFLAVAAPAWLYVAARLLRHQSPLAYEDRPAVPWTGIDVVAACAISFLFQSLPLVVLRLQGIEVPRTGKLPAGSEMSLLIAQAVGGISSFAFCALWLAIRAGADRDALGCRLRRWRYDLASGLIAATFIIPPVLAVQTILMSQMPSEHPLITAIKQSHALLPVATVLAVLVAPLLEEFLFRVVLQGWLEKAELTLRQRTPENFSLPAGVLSVLISSIAFAAAHYGHGADPLPLFLLALVLGYLYHQTHRIWPSLVVHAGLNGLTTAVLWITVLN